MNYLVIYRLFPTSFRVGIYQREVTNLLSFLNISPTLSHLESGMYQLLQGIFLEASLEVLVREEQIER